MAKVDEAIAILKALGLPKPSVKAAYTLLALASMNERKSWKSAESRAMRIHDITVATGKVFHHAYAENTREDFRKGVLKPFEHARVVDRNPEDPTRPTTSPLNDYALTGNALAVVRSFGTAQFDAEVTAFTKAHGRLSDAYAGNRARHMVPVTLPSGERLTLTPGKHNQLQAAIIEQFAPRFAPGGKVLYLGDSADKSLHVDHHELAALGVRITKQDKLPDVLIHLPAKNWLLVVEAVTTSGPVSPKRKRDLEILLSKCRAGRVFITAFQNFKEFKQHVNDIAWETEVWIAENPDHLIHYDGEKFLGPFDANKTAG